MMEVTDQETQAMYMGMVHDDIDLISQFPLVWWLYGCLGPGREGGVAYKLRGLRLLDFTVHGSGVCSVLRSKIRGLCSIVMVRAVDFTVPLWRLRHW